MNSFASGATMTGWLLRTKSCERQPAVRFSPGTSAREIDIPRTSFSRSLSDEAFVAPATAREIAGDLVVTEAAVKQHLLRLYQKFRIPEGANRRTRLANEVIAMGLVRPLPPVHVPQQNRPPIDGARRGPEVRRPGAPHPASHVTGPGRHPTAAGRRAS